MDNRKKDSRVRMGRTPKSVTAANVAKTAGVSLSAVSRTFTVGASVSDETRKKVLDAARQMRYRPSKSPYSNTNKGSHIIAVVVAKLDNLYHSTFLEKLSDALGKIGYRVLVFVTHGDMNLEPVVNELLHFRVDALVLASTALSGFELAEECGKFGIPTITFNAITDVKTTSSIVGANFAGGRLIGAFLAAGGHKRMAYLAGRATSGQSVEREATAAGGKTSPYSFIGDIVGMSSVEDLKGVSPASSLQHDRMARDVEHLLVTRRDGDRHLRTLRHG